MQNALSFALQPLKPNPNNPSYKLDFLSTHKHARLIVPTRPYSFYVIYNIDTLAS